jgi:hypothetical protein
VRPRSPAAAAPPHLHHPRSLVASRWPALLADHDLRVVGTIALSAVGASLAFVAGASLSLVQALATAPLWPELTRWAALH